MSSSTTDFHDMVHVLDIADRKILEREGSRASELLERAQNLQTGHNAAALEEAVAEYLSHPKGSDVQKTGDDFDFGWECPGSKCAQEGARARKKKERRFYSFVVFLVFVLPVTVGLTAGSLVEHASHDPFFSFIMGLMPAGVMFLGFGKIFFDDSFDPKEGHREKESKLKKLSEKTLLNPYLKKQLLASPKARAYLAAVLASSQDHILEGDVKRLNRLMEQEREAAAIKEREQKHQAQRQELLKSLTGANAEELITP